MKIAMPADAATVILVREPYQVLLMRRHRAQAFMGGACVFPGGSLDLSDRDPELLRYARGLDGQKAKGLLQEPMLNEDSALGLFFSAIRELFEEAFVLLAYTPQGDPIAFEDRETINRFNGYRAALHDRKLSLKDLAVREGLMFALDRVVPYAHWITPESEHMRFDARFFLARMPKGQEASHDNIELTGSAWMTPQEALARHAAGEIILMPPTLKTIEELNAFSAIDRLFAHAAQKTIHPILPELFAEGDILGVKLPHDPEYASELHRRPSRQGEPSRVVLKDGIWRTAFADEEIR